MQHKLKLILVFVLDWSERKLGLRVVNEDDSDSDSETFELTLVDSDTRDAADGAVISYHY